MKPKPKFMKSINLNNKKSILFVFVILIILSINAQDKEIEILLDRDTELLECFDLGDNGIVIKTGKNIRNVKDQDWKFTRYSSDLELVWEVPVENTMVNRGWSNPVIVSPDGQFFYQIEVKGINRTARPSKIQLTQINNEGKTNSHEFAINEIGKRVALFCTQKYICILCSQNGKHNHPKKKEFERLILYKIDVSNFKLQRSLIETPKIEDPENSTFWKFIGQDDEKIYFAKTNLKIEEPEIEHEIITVNFEGKLLNEIAIDISIGSKYLVPAKYPKSHYENNYISYYKDFVYETTASGTYFSVPLIGAFSHIQLDKSDNSFYIYGLYGAKEYKKSSPRCEGYYIYKYDQEGKELWNIQNDAPKELALDKNFKYDKEADTRRMTVLTDPDGNTFLYIWVGTKTLYSTIFTKAGDVSESYKREYNDWINPSIAYLDFITSGNSKLNDYAGTIKYKRVIQTHVYYSLSSTGEIIIVFKDRDDEIKIMYFERP